MKKVVLKKVVFVLILLIVVYFVYSKQTSKSIPTYENHSILYISDRITNEDVESIKDSNKDYQNIPISIMTSDIVRLEDITIYDYVAMDIDILENEDIKELANELLQTQYIMFIGDSSIDDLSSLLGHELTEFSHYFRDAEKLMSYELQAIGNEEFQAFRYSDNLVLKTRFELVSRHESAPDENTSLLLCIESFIESYNRNRYFY